MERPSGVQARIEDLIGELDSVIRARKKQAKGNYYFAYVLTVVTILASAVAAISGVAELLNSWMIGVIAFIPACTSVLVGAIKPQNRANVFYRSLDKYRRLRGTLRYGLPDCPSADDVRKVFDDFSETQSSLTKELEALSFDWGQVVNRRPSPEQ